MASWFLHHSLPFLHWSLGFACEQSLASLRAALFVLTPMLHGAAYRTCITTFPNCMTFCSKNVDIQLYLLTLRLLNLIWTWQCFIYSHFECLVCFHYSRVTLFQELEHTSHDLATPLIRWQTFYIALAIRYASLAFTYSAAFLIFFDIMSIHSVSFRLLTWSFQSTNFLQVNVLFEYLFVEAFELPSA